MNKKIDLHTFSLGQRRRVGFEKMIARLMVDPPLDSSV
jgi:hypothetical protein